MPCCGTFARCPIRPHRHQGLSVDFAQRHGHHYGAILIDIQTWRLVDVLADRIAETLADRLANPP